MVFLKDIENAILALEKGKTILYPTDTIWGIGCDATNEKAVESIYKIKKRDSNKSLLVLVTDFKMLARYVDEIPKEIKKYLKKQQKPTTVIYDKPIGIAANAIAKDHTIAIRIVKKGFVFELIRLFNRPIISTSANISTKKTPLYFNEIEKELLVKIDYVVSLKDEKGTIKPSKIVKFVNDKLIVLRS